MIQPKNIRILSCVLLMFIPTMNRTRAADPATTQAVVEPQQQMKAWWEDLAKPEPFASKALLDFSTKPDQAVEFLKANLTPLKLEQKDLDDLMQALGSDDEKVWKPAFEKMKYLDPRLVGDVSMLLQSATEQPARNRLIACLCGAEPDRYKGDNIQLENNGNQTNLVIRTANSVTQWQVAARVSQVDLPDAYSRNNLWQRADRAIILLQHIGTPNAIAVLKEMATGNPDAQPTKIARLAVESLGAGE